MSYVRGEYGRAPGEIDMELSKRVLGHEKIISSRFAETLSPEFDRVKNEVKNMVSSDEDVLSYILFPQVAEKFFNKKQEQKIIKVIYTIVKA